MNLLDRLLGEKVGSTRITPLVIKILLVFTIFLLVSNLSTNYINLMKNQDEQIRLTRELMIKDLKAIYSFASSQYEIYLNTENLPDAVATMEKSAMGTFPENTTKSLALGVKPDGSILFQASKYDRQKGFEDAAGLKLMNESLSGSKEGTFYFSYAGYQYFGIFKYIDKWQAFIIRAEETGEFLAASQAIFWSIMIIIVVLTGAIIFVGMFTIGYMLRFVGIITRSLKRMNDSGQRLELIDLPNAPNDDVTYLGMSYNDLASKIDTLMTIFKKFVTKDVAQRAYKDREINLGGNPHDLTILFTDIKNFTNMTETLGNRIINILNIHYDRAIRHIHKQNGIVGSIIGDALLAVYGTMDTGTNKSLEAVRSAYAIQQVASEQRTEMQAEKEKMVSARGALTDAEEKYLRATLIEVGVGIDGGNVYYGNLGSVQRMTNTVIGDNVNSASRLEGLTRIYRVPVIVSEYVKEEVSKVSSEYYFLELDLVQVKGKTTGKRIYWPIDSAKIDERMDKGIKAFEKGLALYYEGKWKQAEKSFKESQFAFSYVFIDRISDTECPEGWNGIWTMTTK